MKNDIQNANPTGIIELDFKFLGHRDYVHGSSMLNGLLRSMRGFAGQEKLKTSKIKLFKIIKEFNTFAVAESMYTKDCHYHPRLKEATARLDVASGDEKFTALLLPIKDKLVRERIASYDAADYVDKIGFDNNGETFGVIKHDNKLIDLLRGIVEANRQITIKEYDAKSAVEKIRWGYISDFKMISTKEMSNIDTVRFVSKKILPTKDSLFVIKRVQFEGFSGDYNFDICFYIKRST